MHRVFVDMDGVIVDYDGYKHAHGLSGEAAKQRVGSYRCMAPIPGALAALQTLRDWGFEVWLASKPPTGVPHAYADKVGWVLDHVPDLAERLILTPNKGLLGDAGDYLCDDRPRKAHCDEFVGTVIPFTEGRHWPEALAFLATRRPLLEAERSLCQALADDME